MLVPGLRPFRFKDSSNNASTEMDCLRASSVHRIVLHTSSRSTVCDLDLLGGDIVADATASRGLPGWALSELE